MAKIDLVDGSYRVSLSQQAALELMVVLPPNGLSEPLLALPLSLPMVWSHSPPYLPLDYKDIYLDDFMVLAQPPAYIPGMNSLYSTTCILYSKIPKIPPTGRWSPNQKLSRVMPGIALIRTS